MRTKVRMLPLVVLSEDRNAKPTATTEATARALPLSVDYANPLGGKCCVAAAELITRSHPGLKPASPT